MWEYNYTDELYHYGVPGMKWGVHRSNKSYQSGERVGRRMGKRLVKRGKQGVKLTKAVVINPTVKAAKRTVKVGEAVGKGVVKSTKKQVNRTVKLGKRVGKATTKQAKRTAKVANWFAAKANNVMNRTVGMETGMASALTGKKAVEKMNAKSNKKES